MIQKNSIVRQFLFVGIAGSLIAFLFGMWSHFNTHDKAAPKELTLKNGTAFPIPRQIQPFELKSAPNGQPFTNNQLKGHWSMMFFGFTHCAMLCPTTLSTLNQFYGQLATSKVSQLPQIIFISIDPERDSLSRIHQYVTSFNKTFQGATADEAKLDKMSGELNILFSKNNPNNDENYQIDHSGTVLLFDPQGHLAGLFSPPIDAQTLVQDYLTIVKNAK